MASLGEMGWLAALALGLAVTWLVTRSLTRAPTGLALLGPPSACDSCGWPLPAGDQVPALSWLRLRGRCRSCGARIDAAYLALELAVPLLFAATYVALGASWDLPLLWYLGALALVASIIDLRHHRLPDAIVLPSYPITAGLLLLALLGHGDLADLRRSALGGLVLFGGYLLLALVNPAGMGGGDVKLSGVLGMVLGWFGWPQLIVGALAAFFIGAAAGAVLLVLGRAGRKSRIPFGPFMFAGAYVGLLAGEPIARWYLG